MNYSNLSKLQQKEIDEILTNFDLNEKEKQVYLTLLQTGQNTITPLAKLVRLPTTTVQSILGRLTKRGIIATTTKKSRHSYEAHDPIVFKKILEEQAKDFSNIIPILQKLKSEPGISPKIQVYYRERMTDIFQSAIECKSKLIYEIVAAKEFQKIIGERFHFTRKRLQNKVYLKSLRVESQEIKRYSKAIHARELREAKFLPHELTFETNILFWDNTVAFFSTHSEGLAWTVESKSMREAIEQIFELLWSVSRRMETLSE